MQACRRNAPAHGPGRGLNHFSLTFSPGNCVQHCPNPCIPVVVRSAMSLPCWDAGLSREGMMPVVIHPP